MTLLLDVARDWSLFSFAALALVVVFKATGVFNLAQGAMMLVDAYLIYAIFDATGRAWVAVVAVLALQIPFGVAVYVLMRGLMSRQALWSATILTLGLGVMLQAVMSYVWDYTTYSVPSPFPNSFVEIGAGARVSVVDMIGILIAAGLCAAVVLGQRFTRAGLTLRATGESPVLASQAGVNLRLVFALAWCAGLVCAALGATLYAYRSGTNPGLITIGLGAIAPAMVGGLDSLGGVFLGAAVAALGQQLALRYLGGDAAEFALFAMVLIVLVVRPYGFLGTRQVERA
jgi:branched-chain amino acid transport system permease protein